MDGSAPVRRSLRRLVVAGVSLVALIGETDAVPLPVPRPADIAAPTGAVASIPLPVPRPEEDGPPFPPRTVTPQGLEAFGPPSPPATPMAPAPDPTCERLMTEGKVVAHVAAPVSGPDGCGIAAPVTLDAVVLRGGRHVLLTPPALMRCDLAQSLADWLRDDVAPATASEGPLLAIADAAAYVCRSRNWTTGARLSEHASGNAIDILAFHFATRVVGLKGVEARGALTPIRASACARFPTVLGPGSDRFHETDLHLDLQHRRNGFRLCQWDLSSIKTTVSARHTA